MDKSRFASRGESMENVREALKLMPPRPGVLGEINDTILAAALAEVEEWEKTVGILRAVNFTGDEKIASLEARAEAAEAERDEWQAKAEQWMESFTQAAERGDAAHQRREAVEAERDELAKSLRDIVCIYDSPVGDPVEVMQVMVGIARSALIAERERRIPTGDGGTE